MTPPPVRELSCKAIFVAIGHAPSTGLFGDQIDLDPAGDILVAPGTETSVPVCSPVATSWITNTGRPSTR